jgi:hypothetical protein
MRRVIHRTRGRGVVTSLAATLCASVLVALIGTAGASAAPGSGEQLNPKSFGNPATGASKWFPLLPGNQTVKSGHVNKGHRELRHRVVTTVTDVTKVIDGVRAVAVIDQDIDGGEIGEQSIDWLAEDKLGNVWDLGSYTEAYEGGQFVNANDAWLSGVDGGKAGILMKANPTLRTPEWSQGYVPGEGSTSAKVAKTGVSECVPFKCYKFVLVILEGGSEYKHFARGVGGIRTEPRSSNGANEVEELINFTKLSAAGLRELGDEALKLDKHARTEASGVYGSSQPAKRTL